MFLKMNQKLKKTFCFKNVVLMPHAGSATRKARLAMMELACNNLENYLLKEIKKFG